MRKFRDLGYGVVLREKRDGPSYSYPWGEDICSEDNYITIRWFNP